MYDTVGPPPTLACQPECFLHYLCPGPGPRGLAFGAQPSGSYEACVCFGPGVYGTESATSWFGLGNHMGTPGAASPEQTLGQGP